MAKDYKDLVVGLDIGTAKVMAVVAEVMPGGELKLAGLGVAPSNGLKRGVVVNIDATVQSIQQALKEAELMADCKITRVYTGITGSHIRGINSSGMVAVKDREVTPADVARVRGDGARDQHLDRPAPAAGGAAGVRDRRPGREGADRHERHPAGSQGAHRHRRPERGREHHQVRAPLRPGGRAAAAEPAGLQPGGADRRREGTRAWRWWTSAPAPPTWRSSPAARSATRR
jgi:hypothetical protein